MPNKIEKYTRMLIPREYFPDICRICLTEPKFLIPIHEVNLLYNINTDGQIQSIDLPKVFFKYCGIKVECSDGKPQKVCENCVDMVCKAFNFLKLLEESDAILEKVISISEGEKKKTTQPNNEKTTLQNNKKRSGTKITQAQKKSQLNGAQNKQEILLNNKSKNQCVEKICQEDQSLENILKDLVTDYKTTYNEDLHCQLPLFNFTHGLTTTSGEESCDDSATTTSIDSQPTIIDTSHAEPERLIQHDVIINQIQIEDIKNCIVEKTEVVDPNNDINNKLDIGKSINDHTYVCTFKKRKRPKTTKTNLQSKCRRKSKQFSRHDMFKCRFCNLIFLNTKSMIDHFKERHSGFQKCIVCTKCIMNPEDLFFHVVSHSKKAIICKICKLYFEDRKALIRHNDTKEHKQPRTCHFCDKKWSSVSKKRRHLEMVHYPKPKYQCQNCGKMFMWIHNVINHSHLVHGTRLDELSCYKELQDNIVVDDNLMPSTSTKSQTFTSDYKWGRNETKILLDLYAKYKKRTGTFEVKTIEIMWQKIAEELSKLNIHVTANNCVNRWEVLERNYKKFIDNQNKTGRGRKYFEFEVEMGDIFGRKKLYPELLPSNETLHETKPQIEIVDDKSPGETLEMLTDTPREKIKKITSRKSEIAEKQMSVFEKMQIDRKHYYDEILEIEKQKLEEIKKRNKLIQESGTL